MARENELIRAYIIAEQQGDQDAMNQLALQIGAMADEQQSRPSIASGLLRAGAQGISLGTADEAEAFVRSTLGGEDYEQALSEIRTKNQQFREDYPVLSYGAEIAGGIAVPGVMGARLATAAGSRIAQAAQQGNRLAQRTQDILPTSRPMQLGVLGAGEGAIAGAGTATEGERLQGAALGGVLGGVGGAGLGVLERRLAGAAKRQGAQEVETALGPNTAEQATQRMRGMLPETTLAETSQEMRDLAGTAMRSLPEGGGKDDYYRFLLAREETKPERITQAVSEATGVPVGTTRLSAQQALESVKRRETGPMYKGVERRASQEGIDISDDVRRMVREDPDVRSAANAALRSIRGNRKNWDLSIEDVENTFDFWHKTQSALRQAAKDMGTPNRPGRIRMEGARLMGQRDEIVSDMIERNDWGDDYAKASYAYRQRSEAIDALKESSQFSRMPPEDLRAMVSNMSDQEREAFTMGVFADIIKKIDNASMTANQARNLIKSSGMRRRLEILIGDKAKTQEFIRKMESLSEESQTYGQYLGSPTAARQAAASRFTEPSFGNVAAAAMRGDVPGMIGETIQAARGGGTPTMNPRAAQGILELMMEQNPGAALQRLRQMQSAVEMTPGGLELMPGLLGGGVTVSQQEY